MKNLDSKFRRLIIMAAVLVVTCFYAASNVKSAEVVDRIVAAVNDDVITLRELNSVLQPYTQQIRMRKYSEEHERRMLFKLRQDLLNKLIADKLTDQEIKRLNIKVSPKELDNAIERLKDKKFYTDEQLRRVLARDGMSLEDLRQKMEEQILRRRLIDQEVNSKIVVTKEDIRAYYENHPDEYGAVERYHLRNIVMNVPLNAADSEKRGILRRMDALLSQLKAGASFPMLARKFSESPLASDGGDLGFFKLDDLAPQIRSAVAGRGGGEFTDVLDTPQGYQIFYIEEIVNQSQKSLEAASAEISEKLYNEVVDQKFNSWLTELRERSHIRIVQ